VKANDEELAEMLIEVRGIGRVSTSTGVYALTLNLPPFEVDWWVNFKKNFFSCPQLKLVDMFAIFSLRRPDILPVGKILVPSSVA
jgi:hypothetical protein